MLKSLKNMVPLFAALSSAPLWAQAPVNTYYAPDPASLLGAKSSSRAGATAASQLSSDALFQNPASAAFSKKYTVNASYVGLGETLSASIVDTKSSALGGGVFYLRREVDNNKAARVGTFERTEDRAGMAFFGTIAERFSVGVTAKYSYFRPRNNELVAAKAWNGDVGARYIVSRELSFGLVGQNLLKDNTGTNPKVFALAGEYLLFSGFKVSGQFNRAARSDSGGIVVIPDETRLNGYAIGAEYFVNEEIAIRAGFQDKPAWLTQLASAGFGYEAKEYSIDYSFEYSTTGDRQSYHALSLGAFF